MSFYLLLFFSRARSDPTIFMNAMTAVSNNFIDPNNYGIYNTTNNMSSTPTNTYYNGLINNHNTMSKNFTTSPLSSTYSTNNVNNFSNIQQQQDFTQTQQSFFDNLSSNSTINEIANSLPNVHSNIIIQQQASGSTTPTQQPQKIQQHKLQKQETIQQPQLFRLETPLLVCKSSQSAPTSPAQITNLMRQQQHQWPPLRNNSTSPDSVHEIPNIVLTGTDGKLDCFQDLQDLHLDKDLQQLLTNSICIDPALETELLN